MIHPSLIRPVLSSGNEFWTSATSTSSWFSPSLLPVLLSTFQVNCNSPFNSSRNIIILLSPVFLQLLARMINDHVILFWLQTFVSLRSTCAVEELASSSICLSDLTCYFLPWNLCFSPSLFQKYPLPSLHIDIIYVFVHQILMLHVPILKYVHNSSTILLPKSGAESSSH